MKLHLTIILLSCILLLSCKSNIDKEIEVQHYGALRNLMSGNLKTSISLDSLVQKENLYALGALENLKGEIQIFNSAAYISKMNVSNDIKITSSFDNNAALLVYAEVPEWSEAIPLTSFTTNAHLEKQIKEAAIKRGVNVDKPFPFLIKGNPSLLKWHVINWKDGDMEHTHKKHQESGPNGVFQNEEVEIIGFYSEKHKAIFTHHTTFLHMHFKTEYNGGLAGHVDEVLSDDQSTNELELYLPK